MQTHSLHKKHVFSVRTMALIAGVCLVLLAFLVPMDIFGMYHLFAVHMGQHLLLSLLAPPLILSSIVPEKWQRFLGRHQIFVRGLKVLTMPFVASVLFNGNIWFWHAPVLMRAMMSSEVLHEVTNVVYLGTALLFWIPLFDFQPETMEPLSLGKKLIYLFFSDMPMMLIGAGLTFSPPLYSFTMTDPSMHMVITAEDQQLGGLLMWVVGGVFLLVIVSSVLFLRWMLRQEKEQEERERELANE